MQSLGKVPEVGSGGIKKKICMSDFPVSLLALSIANMQSIKG